MKTTIIFLFLILLLSGCRSNSKITVNEEKIHQQINDLFSEAPYPPKSFKVISFSKPDTIYCINLVLYVKINSKFYLNDSLISKDWYIRLTKDKIFIDWDTSLAKYYVKQNNR